MGVATGPMSMFLHGARTYILYNVMYCMLAIFDNKQGCCSQYHRLCKSTRQIPLMCSAYSVGCASIIIAIIRSSSIAVADGIAGSCCTVFYNFIVDPLSDYLSETDFLEITTIATTTTPGIHRTISRIWIFWHPRSAQWSKG